MTINGSKTSTSYTLIPCNRSDWTSLNPSIGKDYDTIGLGSYLCLPSNITFSFTGKYTSKDF
jgi:hypothetical protein